MTQTRCLLLSSSTSYTTEYEILVSDDRQNWKKVAEADGKGLATRVETSFPPTGARYVPLRAVMPYSPGLISGKMTR